MLPFGTTVLQPSRPLSPRGTTVIPAGGVVPGSVMSTLSMPISRSGYVGPSYNTAGSVLRVPHLIGTGDFPATTIFPMSAQPPTTTQLIEGPRIQKAPPQPLPESPPPEAPADAGRVHAVFEVHEDQLEAEAARARSRNGSPEKVQPVPQMPAVLAEDDHVSDDLLAFEAARARARTESQSEIAAEVRTLTYAEQVQQLQNRADMETLHHEIQNTAVLLEETRRRLGEEIALSATAPRCGVRQITEAEFAREQGMGIVGTVYGTYPGGSTGGSLGGSVVFGSGVPAVAPIASPLAGGSVIMRPGMTSSAIVAPIIAPRASPFPIASPVPVASPIGGSVNFGTLPMGSTTLPVGIPRIAQPVGSISLGVPFQITANAQAISPVSTSIVGSMQSMPFASPRLDSRPLMSPRGAPLTPRLNHLARTTSALPVPRPVIAAPMIPSPVGRAQSAGFRSTSCIGTASFPMPAVQTGVIV